MCIFIPIGFRCDFSKTPIALKTPWKKKKAKFNIKHQFFNFLITLIHNQNENGESYMILWHTDARTHAEKR